MRRLVPFLALGALTASCGGSSGGNACLTNADCSSGTICIDGECIIGGLGDMGRADRGGSEGGGGDECVDEDFDGFSAVSDSCPSGDDCRDDDRNINPGVGELCGDGMDNDCDGETDEPDCSCTRGARLSCYSGALETAGVGICRRGITICVEEGVTDDCRGEVLPGEETCDGTDEDCDGEVDEGLRNACGACGEAPMELCGNEIDDDCDGFTDEDCDCDFRCECAAATSCVCEPPTNQPCYEGPFATGGRGACAGGRRDCVAADGENRWGECVGQILPTEECAVGVNDVDDDCDGVVDEGCADNDSDGTPFPLDCDDGDPNVFPGADETCNGRDDNCDGVADEGVTNACGGCGTPAARDECGNGLDDDCNSTVDDGCACEPGTSTSCYGGPDGTQGVGACLAGTFTCEGNVEFPPFGECTGQVTPLPEICNGIDDDCDGEEDERYATGSNACGFCDPTEVCDGEDQDCDGRTDEGVANACGECGPLPAETCNGVDDDCDGATDEGVTNACGTCPPEPCFEEDYDELADCELPGRTCDDVEEDPEFPGSITLGASNIDFDYIYIAVTGRNEVAQLDTRTGVKNWQVPSFGRFPSRTAVAPDGSVWVGNRAHTASNATDVTQSNVVHLAAEDGSLICRAPVLNVARSIALDRNGDIWAGSFNNGDLYHISGTMVDESTSPPTCVVLRQINVGEQIYGLAADPDGFIWTASSPTVRVNIDTYASTTFTNPSHYGIASDARGNMWFAGWRGEGPVHAMNRVTGAITNTSTIEVTAITVDTENNVYGSAYNTNQLVKINGVTGAEICRGDATSGANPHGVAIDSIGRIWMPARFTSGAVSVFNPDCSLEATYVVDAGQELYSYSDMTGNLLRTIVAPQGSWTQVFDSGYAEAYWTELTYDSIEPAGTDIIFTLRTADTEAGLPTGVACGPFNESPSDLSVCGADFQRKRFIQVEALLTRSGTDERPVLRSVDVAWAY
ncbi:MAG: MopE-related protein [Myxococcota bacterium]